MTTADGIEADMAAPVVQEDIAAPPARRHWGLIALKWTGIALATLALLVAAVFFGLNTAPGKRFIADRIAGTQFENGLGIQIGRIQGSIYGDIVLRDVALTDTKGVFANSPEIRVDYRPWAYWNNHVDIRSLTAELVTLRRVPVFKETPPSDEPLLPDLDIDIGRLRIDRFVAEPPVSGERRVLTLSGEAHIADRRAQVQLAARTLAGGGSEGGDRLALKLDAVPEQNRLDLDVAVDAPQGGVIVALAGLNEPLAVRLAGRGTWAAWNGKLATDLAGSDLARLNLSFRDGTVRATGPTRIARLFEGATARLLGPVAEVDVTGRMEERRVDLAGTLSSDALRLNANGLVDLSDNTLEDMRVNFALLRPSAVAQNLAGSGLRGQLILNGDFATPRVRYAVNANRLLVGDTGLVNVTARGDAEIRADQIFIPVSARVARVTGLDTVAGGQLANVRLDGDLAIDGTRILSDNLRLQSDRIDAGLILVADTATGLYNTAFDGRIDDYRLQSVGIFDVVTDFDLETVRGGLALAGRVQARSTRLFNEGVRDFLGGNASGAANVRYGPDGIIRFSGLTLRAPAVRIARGEGFYRPDGRLALAASGTTTAYGPVGVQVAGTLANPNIALTATRPNLGIGLANLRATITRSGNGYRLSGTGDTDYGPLTGDVVLGTGEQLSFDIARANLAGIDFSGSLRQSAAGPFIGRLDADGQGLAGVARLGAQGRFQEALVNLRARDTVLPGPVGLAVGSAAVDARIILYPDQPHVVADVQLANTRVGQLDLAALRALVDYRNGSGTARMLAEGAYGVPFRVAANAALQPDLWRVAAQGRARGIPFRTVTPARIVPGRDRYELLPTRIDLGQGNLRLAGTYGDGLVLQSRLDRIDLAIVNAFVPGLGIGGTATGSLDFAQANPAAFPRADARLEIDDFRRTTAALVSQPVDATFVGKLLPDGGEARAVMRRRGAVIGRMVASLRPLGAGSGTWTQRLLAAPLSGGVRYNGPADTLFSFAGLRDQRVSGPIGVAADFTGRVGNPQLAGIVRASNLTYENQIYGTRLTNLALAGRFDGSRLEIERATARAGDGRASAQGSISLSASTGFPMDIAVTLDNARVARGDALSATATGAFRLTKAAGEDALVRGDLTLPNTRYQLVRQGAAEVPVLTGVRFKGPSGPRRVTGNEQGVAGPSLFDLVRLDLGLKADERMYVSGMGLESEWEADLRLLGTTADPRFVGEATLIRGTLGFAGRSFELARGRVAFLGGATINPTIDMVASEQIEDITVNVVVSGRAYDPQVTFTSVPGLPQDEIVARILFGSSIGNLSAIQAVQLAASLNSLRATGGGLNPLGKLRSAVGIDRLRILGADETAGRGTAIAAGEYLTDDIYLEFITDARGFTATQIEISLTPALSILSQVGGSGTSNVNVQYRKNY